MALIKLPNMTNCWPKKKKKKEIEKVSFWIDWHLPKTC